ncbi:GNAT family N-acetyltransferase [Nocardioides humilatus]|uniref:GNAT family N-acetyltransferase n=2 Tax=Nocardioides humilatus TaxID=2607660 RepID=A0A5B1L5W1_9ACTN|nr:GNAT family N-acetyltransferase [Nocardioides humilatus]
MAAQELHDIGSVEIEEEDLIAEWQRPSYDLGASTVAVLEGDRIVAYADLIAPERYDVAVHPEARGRGIGTWLAAWIRDLAARRGARIVGMPVPEGSAGDRLLTGLGYHVRWTSWVLRLPEGRVIEDRPLPEGYALREATESDREQVWHVIEDAFLEWSDREKQTFDDFAAEVWQRPGFEPWNLQVVVGPNGAIAGAIFTTVTNLEARKETYVSRVAVHKDHRNRGLAQSLLVAAFAIGRAHGAAGSCLSTDSRTGALALYEKVGMVADAVWLHRATHLV